MRKQFKIKTFDDLIEFIETQNVSTNDLEKITAETIGVYAFLNPYTDKSQLIKQIKDYWSKYGNQRERPIFLLDFE